MKTVAAILAGGKGTRFGSDVPKQFVPVSGRMIIEYTVEAFEKNDSIDEICIVAGADYISLVKKLAADNGWKKVAAVIPGGARRQDSSFAAISHYSGQDANILIHDAARPKVGAEVITAAAQALSEYEAVCAACPATDTIAISAPEGGIIKEIPPRRLMYHVQTPQGFRLEIIKKAYEAAMADPEFSPTDDCGVLKRYMPDIPIKIIEGSSDNVKITRTGDLRLL